MKKSVVLPIVVLGIAIGLGIYSETKKMSTRDLNYEQYCDSIWANDVDYYLDVLMEEDEYQNYIEEHGEWWN